LAKQTEKLRDEALRPEPQFSEIYPVSNARHPATEEVDHTSAKAGSFSPQRLKISVQKFIHLHRPIIIEVGFTLASFFLEWVLIEEKY
jgi:hypothetical protein